MKRLAVVVLLLVMLAACGKPAPNSPEAALRESFRALKAAFRNNLGQEAARHVTTETLDMYERCRKLALDSSGTDLESLPQMEVLMVMQLRWLVAKADLQKMDGAGVFAWGVENGLAKKETLESLELDKVEIAGDKATATLLRENKPMPDLTFVFAMQDGVWRLDFTRIFAQTEPLFAADRKQNGKTKVQEAVGSLQASYKKDVPPEIFTGPLK